MIEKEIIKLLEQVLSLDPKNYRLHSESPLLGAIPEFDSLAVVSVLTALEDKYSLVFDDDDIEATLFENVGSLVRFIEASIAAKGRGA